MHGAPDPLAEETCEEPCKSWANAGGPQPEHDEAEEASLRSRRRVRGGAPIGITEPYDRCSYANACDSA